MRPHIRRRRETGETRCGGFLRAGNRASMTEEAGTVEGPSLATRIWPPAPEWVGAGGLICC
jgi:hypothetical protein